MNWDAIFGFTNVVALLGWVMLAVRHDWDGARGQ